MGIEEADPVEGRLQKAFVGGHLGKVSPFHGADGFMTYGDHIDKKGKQEE